MTWLAEVNSGETGEKGLVLSGEKLFQASSNFSYQSELKASVQIQGRDNWRDNREENQQSSNLFDAPASFHPAWNARNLLCQSHSCSLDRAHSMHGPWIFVACNGAWCIEISLKHFECLQALKDAFDRWFLKFYIHPNGPEVVIYSTLIPWKLQIGMLKDAMERPSASHSDALPHIRCVMRMSMSSWKPRSKACLIKQNQFLAASQDLTNLYMKHRMRLSGWWFQKFFIFTPTWGNDPIWLILFKRVETAN